MRSSGGGDGFSPPATSPAPDNVRGLTVLVAGVDSMHKGRADYVAEGVDDQVTIQAAIDSTRGAVELDGTFKISSLVWVETDDVSIRGMGDSTRLVKVSQTRRSVVGSGTVATVDDAAGLFAGQTVFIRNTDLFEVAEIAALDGTTVTLTAPLENVYPASSYLIPYFPVIYVTGDRVTLSHLLVDGNRAGNEDTSPLDNGPDDDWGDVHLAGSHGSQIINVSVVGSQFNGLNAVYTTDLTITGGRYDGSVANGVNLHQGNVGAIVQGVHATGNDDDGFEADNGTTHTIFTGNIGRDNGDRNFKAISGTRVTFAGNQSIGGKIGIEVFGTGGVVSGNLIQGPVAHGIYVYDGTGVTVTGNTIIGAGVAGIYVSSWPDEASQGIVVADNALLNCGDGAEESSIEIMRADGFSVSGNVIQGGGLYAGIHIWRGALKGQVLGNVGAVVVVHPDAALIELAHN